MNLHDRTVQTDRLDLDADQLLALQLRKESIEHTGFGPAVHAPIDRVPVTESLQQRTPLAAERDTDLWRSPTKRTWRPRTRSSSARVGEIVVLVWVFSVMPGVLTRAAGEQAAGVTVWDGVYTEEQANKGGALYRLNCAMCHGETLDGIDTAAALKGDLFNASWNGATLDQLSDRIRLSMPLDRPASLSRNQVADIIAYILRVNQFPTGAMSLDASADALARVKYESVRPQLR
jgi:hypothetical protein